MQRWSVCGNNAATTRWPRATWKLAPMGACRSIRLCLAPTHAQRQVQPPRSVSRPTATRVEHCQVAVVPAKLQLPRGHVHIASEPLLCQLTQRAGAMGDKQPVSDW